MEYCNINKIKEVITSTFDIRDYTINADKNLPEKYSCPESILVKDQGSKPTCVAHAAASVIEYHHQHQHDNNYRKFSTEFIYGFRDTGYYVGDGMMIRNALKTLQNYGTPYETDCPGNHDIKEAMDNVNKNLEKYKELAYPHRISTYYRCNSIDEIKTAVIKHGPVLVSMNTYYGAKIVDDVYTYDTYADYGKHCVIIYGWDKRGWLIQNSWGTGYAGDGRFVIPFDYKFNEAWGITDNIISDEINVKKENAFMAFLYKIYNAIVNWWLNLTNKD